MPEAQSGQPLRGLKLPVPAPRSPPSDNRFPASELAPLLHGLRWARDYPGAHLTPLKRPCRSRVWGRCFELNR